MENSIRASDPNDPNARYKETLSKNTLFKIDKVLEYVCHDMPPGKTAIEISNFIMNKYGIDLGETNTIMILYKLKREKYVKIDKRDGKPQRYLATLDGVLLNDNGGYTKKAKRDVIRKALPTIQLWVTVIGAGLSGLYVLGKVVLYLYDHLHLDRILY